MQRFKVSVLLMLNVCLLSSTIAQHSLSKWHVQKTFKKFVSDTLLRPASISFSFADLKHKKILFSENEHKALIPASSLKIISCAMVLDELSSNFRYQTPFLLVGDGIINGTFYGNLEIIGSGDPAFGSVFLKGNPDLNTICDSLFSKLQSKGIHSIHGKIVVNQNYISDLPENKEWLLYDLGNYYGAGCYSFNYAENLARIRIAAAAQDQEFCNIVSVQPDQLQGFYTSKVVGKNTLYDKDVYVIGFSQSCRQEIHGEWKCCTHDTLLIRSAIANPSTLFSQLLKESLEIKGIKILDQTPLVTGHSEIIYQHNSLPLSQIVEHALNKSVNLYCESFVHELGRIINGTTNRQMALQAMNKRLAALFKTGETAILEDGSGLSPKNLVSTSAFIQILNWIHYNNNLMDFWKMLPDVSKQGALSKYGKLDSRTKFYLKLKSGSMERVRSYTGYIIYKDKPVYSISLIVNHYTCNGEQMNALIAKFFSELVNPN